MPIKPPNLDDRRYADIVREAQSLIPQSSPEWTNTGDADPGMTLVQLFAWMTELTIYRLNRVPDKTYVHFLNVIGEERKRAQPARVPLTFSSKGAAVEVAPFTKCSTRQREDNQALDFLTVGPLTVHGSRVTRMLAVRGGPDAAVRELPFGMVDGNPSALVLSQGKGLQAFDLDPQEYGVHAYTPHELLYVAHDDLRLMAPQEDQRGPPGLLALHQHQADLSIADFFHWEYPTAAGWMPIEQVWVEAGASGLPETRLVTHLPGIVPTDALGEGPHAVPLPELVQGARWWIRGRLDYEAWLARRMKDDLEVSWKDDRGGEERALHTWEVRASGRTLELFIQDIPPLRAGWQLRLELVDRGIAAGRNSTLPRYRWSYRRGETWEDIAVERVRTEGSTVVLSGPLPDMATDGYNLRAERIETVHIRGFVPELELDLTWQRPVEIHLAEGDDPRRSQALAIDEGPWSPFQINPAIPPTIGRKFYIGSDLFENRRGEPVVLDLDVGFELNGNPIPEPKDRYLLQLTYKAEDSWRVVWTQDKLFSGFTWADLDPKGAAKAEARTIRIVIDPQKQLKGLDRTTLGQVETAWLRIELVKASLTGQDQDKQEKPIAPRILGVRLGTEKAPAQTSYEQPMPGPRAAHVTVRDQNRRLTRVIARAAGRFSESYPFDPFVEIDEPNQALYLRFDKALPSGARHAIQFRTRGETWLPEDVRVDWEILEEDEHGRLAWQRIPASDGARPYDLSRTGVLSFPLVEAPQSTSHGFWLRGRFAVPAGQGLEAIPPLPGLTHVLLNTVEAVNLHTVRTERYSGLGTPHQAIELLKKPVFVHPGPGEQPLFADPGAFDDVAVWVEKDDGTSERWKPAPEGNLLTAGKDDKVFVVDPVDGTLTFGNGIRGRMLPAGSNNVLVDTYRHVPGAQGNVGPNQVVVCERHADALKVTNLLPANGGRNAEGVDEIVRRAPSILTSRDRAVTRADFEIIAREASGEVARAACVGGISADGEVEVTILPQRREEEEIPDPFLSEGLREHVRRHLEERCLINVRPVVRLARFLPVDASLVLRLRPNANLVAVRAAAEAWVRRFLDPYEGGLDGEGWPFQGTLYAQDFARMVSDLPEIRHVVRVDLYAVSAPDPVRAPPAWEEGEGQDELFLTAHDLVWTRRVRVRFEGDEG